MIIQPGTVYDKGTNLTGICWLLKDGVDQTGGGMVTTGTWAYSADDGGYIYSSTTPSATIGWYGRYFTRKYFYVELRAMVAQSNYMVGPELNGANWLSTRWSYSDLTTYHNGTNYLSLIYEVIYGKGTMAINNRNMKTELADDDIFSLYKTFNTVRIYNVYCVDWLTTPNFISPSWNIRSQYQA